MSKEFKHIIRIKGTDLEGSKKVTYGLTKIKGVGVSMANTIVKIGELKADTRLGNLTDTEISKIEEIISDFSKYSIPSRLVNRRKDVDSGRDIHLITADLTLRTKNDIDFMKNIKSWKGIRHSLGLKVRGQRTKCTGRTGRSVGVKKKLLIAAAKKKRAE
ncbi:MAG: 30S ribosomal protein S13 [Candidatus Bathyarchaeota archaeon]|nr:30S ribosomal protein S13 [Candidatus Bathyarchaeota archaeon]